MAKTQRTPIAQALTFDRKAIVSTMTDAVCNTLLSFDNDAHEFDNLKVERNETLLTSIEEARAAHVHTDTYDAAGYMGVIVEVLGDGQNGRVKNRIPGTVYDVLRAVVAKPAALSSTLSGARTIANWYADRSVSLRRDDGTFHPFNLLVEVARGKRNMAGDKIAEQASTDATGAAQPADATLTPTAIKAQVAAWVKAGMAWDVTDALATALKASTDKAIVEIAGGITDCAAELKTANGSK